MKTAMEIRRLPKKDFPKPLLELPQPPEQLYIIGDLPSPDFIYLSVVGSRKFTSYGREACEKIIAGLKGYPIVIVSGFAMGIDTIAHKAAMKAGLITMVFPGSGLSTEAIFPKTNINLMEEIVESHGCFVSEFEPDFKAQQWSFPMRNRLMAGISKAVLIIEAEEKSGTLITARLATEYNRDVLAVPGSIFSVNANGTNKLIRQGATPIRNATDVLEALGFEIDELEANRENKQAKLFEELSAPEKRVVELLREPIPRDELIKMLKLSIQETNALLSIMKIKEIIKEEAGELRLV